MDDEGQRRLGLADPRNTEVRPRRRLPTDLEPAALPVADQTSRAGAVTGAGEKQSDRSPMTMAYGDLLLLSHGSLGVAWTQTGFARGMRARS